MPRTRSAPKCYESDQDNTTESGFADEEENSIQQGVLSKFARVLERFRHEPSGNDILTPATTPTSKKRALEEEAVAAPSSKNSSARAPKRRRRSRKYAPPSRYAHLPKLIDVLEPGLICVFVGTNPGIRTATAGHAYAHPSNHFWRLLHSSGCTDVCLRPAQDIDLPRRYAMGNTNIVDRPSKDAAELSKAEMAAGTPVLEEKVARFRPEAVCLVGKGIWEAVWRWRYGREIRKDEFYYGWQDDRERMGKGQGWEGARVFVATSTSGLSASTSLYEKEAIWRPLGEWVKMRRMERLRELEGG